MPTVNAGTTCYVTATFKDKTGASSAPDSASWRAIDLESGDELQADTALIPAASIEIVVDETVNALVNPANPVETRRIIVEAVVAGEPVTSYYDYQLHSLEKS